MQKSGISLATPTAQNPASKTRITAADFVSASFKAVKPVDRFKTDVQISNDSDRKTGDSAARDLQPWIDDAPSTALDLNEAAGWDQFAVNKEKFGVESTWDETLYTTQLDMSEITSEQRQTAEKISKELEGAQVDDESELDEEARFSAVLGTGRFRDANSEVKIEPRKRNKQKSKRKNKNRKSTQIRSDPELEELIKLGQSATNQPARDITATYLSSWIPGPPVETESILWDQ